MDLLQLRYFKIAAEEQHITKTAEKLHISQSSLSKTIRTLENELGVKLFDREGRNVRLNENGQIFLRHVRQSLNSLDSGVKELRDRSENSYPDLVIYVQAGISILPRMISGFSQKYPNIHFVITKKQYQDPHSKRGCDLIISLPLLEDVNDTNTITLMEEDMLMAVSDDHWAAERSFIALEEMRDEPFITFVNPATYRKNTEIFCKMAGFTRLYSLKYFQFLFLLPLLL